VWLEDCVWSGRDCVRFEEGVKMRNFIQFRWARLDNILVHGLQLVNVGTL